MEAIQNSIQMLTEHFNTQMEEFQKNLQGAIPATSPISNIAGQFTTFRTFVLSALASLQQQVEFIAKQTDQLEMRSRRKMLLVHGIPEGGDGNLSATVSSLLSKHLQLSDLQDNCFTRCQRLGQPKGEKPRVILVKFQDLQTRNKVWFAKTFLRNTGYTLSEFLTKDRHDAFMAARRKFGVSKCWTREGFIMVIGHDGKRHRVTTKTEVGCIQAHGDSQVPPTVDAVSSAKTAPQAPKVSKPMPNETARSKRVVRK